MGSILNIRVIAQTLDEEDVGKAWPGLCSLVWPEWSARLKLKSIRLEKLLGPTLGPSPVEKALGGRTHGVLELAEGLGDLLRFGSPPAAASAALDEPVKAAVEIADDIAAALSDWDPKRASGLTNKLESALDQAEKALNKASGSA